ncbi:MAG TPA: hypothetical protein VGN74_04275 [Brevundimonas sp.]|jgi:hypothetical protein|uniref:hypothetical protein n=1 Tax=Brevundimonas sp. TaxID=1871086 RepID=UPI002E0F764B|nr:hypothetical protein [Brevundimonas sp.]
METVRLILLLALGAAALTTAALALGWWMEPERRLRRALDRLLGRQGEAQAIAALEGKAAALDFESAQAVVLWDQGAKGLVYAFDEVSGAELIVDGHVVARVRRGEPRRDLDVLAPDAGQVALRLMFDDARDPEFEVALYDVRWPTATHGPGEALRLGRRWLSHVEALTK